MTSANPENMLKHNKENSEERVPLLSRTQDEKVMTDKYSGASFHGSVFNLSCTIVGSGIMSLPATLKMLGLVPGIVLIIIVAFVIEASIEMLLRFSKAGSAYSYGDAMADAFGRIGKVLLQICIVIYNTGSLIVYMIIIAQKMFVSFSKPEDVLSGSTSKEVHHAGILEGWFGEHWWTSRAFVLVAVTVFIFFPLMFFERIDSARYISVISVGLAIVFLLVVIGVTTFKLVDGSIETPKWFPAVTDSTSFLNLFTAVPVVVFAYICHYNVHTIQNELSDSSLIQGVVRGSLALCAVVYVMTGIFGDPHCIATTKDKIVSVSMIILAVVSNVMAIYSNLSSSLS
ncbi:hypothetical protein ACE6H2_012053 [Prunus campanulata]